MFYESLIFTLNLLEAIWRQAVPQYLFWILMLLFAFWLFYRGLHKNA